MPEKTPEESYFLNRVGSGFVLGAVQEKYPCDIKYILEKIKFDGTINYSEKSISGIAELSISSIVRGQDSIELDAINFEISEVRINGHSVKFEYDGKIIALKLPPVHEDKILLRVEYKVTDPPIGLHIDHSSAEFPEAWVRGGGETNSYWLPIFDHPNMKMRSELSITVPENQIVIANGILISTEVPSPGEKKYNWVMDHPHSSYLIAFYAGEFDQVLDSFGKIALTYSVPKGRVKDISRSFGKTKKMLEFFSKFFGMSYPFESYSQTCVIAEGPGAMENITATQFSDWTLHDEIAHLDFSSDEVVSHELAHQWFGDLVTHTDWADKWLNEGFASFFQCLFFRADRGEEEYAYQLFLQLDHYLEECKKRYIRPVSTKIYSFADELRDRHSYDKGSLFLHSLMNLIGEEVFRKSITSYLEKFRFKNVETDDFRKVVDTEAMRSLQWFFDQWIYNSGHPNFVISYSFNKSRGQLKINFRQVQEIPKTFHLPIDVRIKTAEGNVAEQFFVSERDQDFSIPLNDNPEYICFDPFFTVIGTIEVIEDDSAKLTKIEKDEHLFCKLRCLRSLTEFSSVESQLILDDLLSPASSKFWGLQVEGAKTLGKIASDPALEILVRGVRHPNPRVRRSVVEALGKFPTRRVYALLVSVLNSDESYYVRAEAAGSLGKLRDPNFLDPLT
ncbi:MAG: M1 family aminopeptidase, partial [Nitrososphaerales archaeon]